MLPILNLGPLAIPLPGLILILGVWIATSVIERNAPKFHLPPIHMTNIVLIGLVAGVVGARGFYVLKYFSIYTEAPWSIFSLNPATLAPGEGVMVGGFASWIYAHQKKLPLWSTLDGLAPGLAIFGIAWGFANLASGNAFGAPANLPWTIHLWGAERHPSQIYEMVSATLVYLIIRHTVHATYPAGYTFLSWLGLAAISRLMLEAFRGDSVIRFGVIREAQLISLGVLLLTMLALHFRARSRSV